MLQAKVKTAHQLPRSHYARQEGNGALNSRQTQPFSKARRNDKFRPRLNRLIESKLINHRTSANDRAIDPLHFPNDIKGRRGAQGYFQHIQSSRNKRARYGLCICGIVNYQNRNNGG